MHEEETPDEDDQAGMNYKKDIYANVLCSFFGELETLAAEADKQCEIEQYYNVAWEIRFFFVGSAGSVLGQDAALNLPEVRLTNAQREALSALLAEVEVVPDVVVNVPNLRENHLNAMRNPCWVPLRIKARELASLLEPQRRWAYSELGMAEQL